MRIHAALALLGVASLPARAAERPNIVFIMSDDHAAHAISAYGSRVNSTPNLDRLAREGLRFRNVFAVNSICSPSRASLLTGRYVAHTGVYTVVRPNAAWGLPLAERTLAQALREAGYATAIIGKWHLGEFQPGYRPTQRGFDHQYGLWFGAIDYFTHLRGGQLDWHREDQLCRDEGYSTHLIAKDACRWIREAPAGKPLPAKPPPGWERSGALFPFWSSRA